VCRNGTCKTQDCFVNLTPPCTNPRSYRNPHPNPTPITTTIILVNNLSDIVVLVPFLALHVILLNQPIDILLNVLDVQDTSAPGGLDDLCDQLRVSDGLAALHDAHNGRLRLEVAVRRHALVRLLVLLLGLLELHLVDLDPVFLVSEAVVDAERVRVGNLSALGVFG